MRPEVQRARFEITRTGGRGEFPVEVNVNRLEVRVRFCHLSERPKMGDVSTARREKLREIAFGSFGYTETAHWFIKSTNGTKILNELHNNNCEYSLMKQFIKNTNPSLLVVSSEYVYFYFIH